MIRKNFERIGIAALLLLFTSTTYTSTANATVTWSSPGQVPANQCIIGITTVPCIDQWPATMQDQLGRIWLAFQEQPQGDPFARANVYYRLYSNGTWGTKVRVSLSSSENQSPSITSLSNGTVMIAWSSNRTGTYQLFYRLYSGTASPPKATSGEVRLTATSFNETQPSLTQDRAGRIWVAWNKQQDVYYKFFNGTTWSSETPLPAASTASNTEYEPSIMQRKDGKMMVAWSYLANTSDTSTLYYTSADDTMAVLPASGLPTASWAAPRQFFTDLSNPDEKPAITQERDGTLISLWQRTTTQNVNIYWVSSSNNGTTWTSPSLLDSGASDENDVTVAPMSDDKVWVFYDIVGPTGLQLWTTTSNALTGIHDVGLINLASSSYFIRSGDTVNITVSVANYGDYSETTNLNVRLTTSTTTTTLKTMSLALSIGNRTIVKFGWNSSQTYPKISGFWGRYNLTATLTAAPSESPINQGDNSLNVGLLRISPLGDLNRDGKVDILDAARLAFAYGSTGCSLVCRPVTGHWDPEADLDHDGVVTILDAATLAFYFGDSV